MGLFDKISSSINDAKKRAEMENAEFAGRVQYANLKDACQMSVRKLNNASLPMKGSISKIIRIRIQNEENCDELYRAFVDMYEYAKYKRDIYALNISQWIGSRLYDLGDGRVELKQRESDGKNIYIPDDPYRRY